MPKCPECGTTDPHCACGCVCGAEEWRCLCHSYGTCKCEELI